MLSSPTILTPNVPVFDFVSGQTVSVTQLSGGNPALAADHRRQLSTTLSYKPLPKRNFALNANYVATDTRHLAGALPPATAAAEAAFPDRYLRAADGELVEVDGRAVNFSRERRAQLRWGFNGYWPSGPGSEGSTQLLLAIHDTWYFSDAILIRDGLPEIDLLHGGTIGATGGQPRQQFDLQAGFTTTGSAPDQRPLARGEHRRWRQPRRGPVVLGPDDGQPAAVREPRGCGCAEGFGMGARPARRAGRGQCLQRTSARPRRDGAIPFAYQPAYLDPLGRVIRLDVRKVF